MERRYESIKIQNPKKSMLIIIILHLYNLGIMVDESIYKKKLEKCKTNIVTKTNKIIRLYRIKHIVVSGLSLDAHCKKLKHL